MQRLMNRRRRPSRSRNTPRDRDRRVRRIRAAIRAGQYENSLKLDVALDRLIDRVCGTPAAGWSGFPRRT